VEEKRNAYAILAENLKGKLHFKDTGTDKIKLLLEK
jgi:hypothetical protein